MLYPNAHPWGRLVSPLAAPNPETVSTHSTIGTAAHTAGCRVVEVLDGEKGIPFPVLVTYPSIGPEQPERIGPYDVNVALEAPVASGAYSLVVISHGSGGSSQASAPGHRLGLR